MTGTQSAGCLLNDARYTYELSYLVGDRTWIQTMHLVDVAL